MSVLDIARILPCNILRSIETAALKCCDILRHSVILSVEIEELIPLRHSAIQWKPGLN